MRRPSADRHDLAARAVAPHVRLLRPLPCKPCRELDAPAALPGSRSKKAGKPPADQQEQKAPACPDPCAAALEPAARDRCSSQAAESHGPAALLGGQAAARKAPASAEALGRGCSDEEASFSLEPPGDSGRELDLSSLLSRYLSAESGPQPSQRCAGLALPGSTPALLARKSLAQAAQQQPEPADAPRAVDAPPRAGQQAATGAPAPSPQTAAAGLALPSLAQAPKPARVELFCLHTKALDKSARKRRLAPTPEDLQAHPEAGPGARLREELAECNANIGHHISNTLPSLRSVHFLHEDRSAPRTAAGSPEGRVFALAVEAREVAPFLASPRSEAPSNCSEDSDLFAERVLASLRKAAALQPGPAQEEGLLSRKELSSLLHLLEGDPAPQPGAPPFPFELLQGLVQRSLAPPAPEVAEPLRRISAQIAGIFGKLDRWRQGRDRAEYLEVIEQIAEASAELGQN